MMSLPMTQDLRCGGKVRKQQAYNTSTWYIKWACLTWNLSAWDRRKPSTLEDWLYDFEQQLKNRAIQRSKWGLALKCKMPGLDLGPEDSQTTDYDELRDNILKQYGPEDPWGVMLTRLFGYQPHEIPPYKAIGDLRRLQNLMTRVAQRVYKGKPELAHVVGELIPRLISVKLEMGIPTVTKNQLLSIQSKTTTPTLADYKRLLDWERFPFNLEFRVNYTDMVHDYTKLKAEDEDEQRPSVRVPTTPAEYYIVMNPLKSGSATNAIGVEGGGTLTDKGKETSSIVGGRSGGSCKEGKTEADTGPRG